MKRLSLLAGAVLVMTTWFTGAHAALLSLGPDAATEGLTYTLEMQVSTANPLVANFALLITGENSASDTIGGRTGINAIALNTVSRLNPNTGLMTSTTINGVTNTSPSFQFVAGGIGSSGCNSAGGFFCYDNTAIPPTPASPLIAGPVVLRFNATLDPGSSWAGYTTALKIDWVGPNHNNYSLVSEAIPVNTNCPDCTPTPHQDAPEPASLVLLGTGLFGLGLLARRQRRR